ncbi:hypothetical protein [Rubripirellula reticaptiva]|uniref:Uncharacterized protein n=1 Tax=Rubripirellula reticaptiva TaxID=2528013 RepID=A0A5C6EDD6_9BACT|nr:hypothetical protein [Rubripirellula reticaptiva]TWU47713.1 hypothetical protein Poly59_45540 [Rubripirellula reticaptiva]
MSHIYLYERKQRRMAMTLLFNMGALFLMYVSARMYIEPSAAREQLFYWINIAFPLVELCLFFAALFFWIRNRTFKIAVDSDRFEMADPIFETASFSVLVSEIVEIKQTYQNHVDFSTIMMYMRSGEKIQISKNYRYDLGKLYAALAAANSSIRLPEHALRFKQK